MLEILLCSLVTIVPDYLFRRYYQNKRIGKEITLYSVWFELRWGITSCVILAVLLITVIFYNHPSTTSVTMFFRTIPIVPETNGRVAEVYAGFSGPIAKGAPIFRLDSSQQEAAAETARRKIAEVDAEIALARIDIVKADGQIQEARSSHQQAVDELETKRELQRRNPGIVPFRDIERLELAVGRPPGCDHVCHGCKTIRYGTGLGRSPGPESQRRSRAGPGRSGTEQDGCPCRREWAIGAIRASRGRYRQSVHASGRDPDPRRRRSTSRCKPASDRSKRRS